MAVLGGKILLSRQTLGHGGSNVVVVDARAVRRRSMGVHVKSISVYRADRVAASLLAHGGHQEVVAIRK